MLAHTFQIHSQALVLPLPVVFAKMKAGTSIMSSRSMPLLPANVGARSRCKQSSSTTAAYLNDLTANPYHKGSDPTVQAARVETARAIDLSVAAKRAVAQSESNLDWFRRNVQQLVEDVQFAAQLNTFSCVSVVFYSLVIFHADGCT